MAESAMDFEIIIIGAGASGMMAGIAAASYFKENARAVRIAIIERHPAAGRKLLATGNGLCNLSNIHAVPQSTGQYYYGEDAGLISDILSGFTPDRTVEFFEKTGVLCRTEADGRIYPYNNQSSAVRDALAEKLEELGVVIFSSTEVKSLSIREDGFTLTCEAAASPVRRSAQHAGSGRKQDFPGALDASGAPGASPVLLRSGILIIAAGGKASAALSSDGLGYPMCIAAGHTCTPLYPAIVRLKAQNMLDRDLSGVKMDAELSLIYVTHGSDGGEESRELIARESGEFLLTADGISGPPVLQLAGHMKRAGESYIADVSKKSADSDLQNESEKGSYGYYILADFFTAYDNEKLADVLVQRTGTLAGRGIEKFFDGLLPLKLARACAARIFGTNTGRRISSVRPAEIAGSLSILKQLPFKITGTAGWDNAQITAGGIRLAEIDSRTMESKLCHGLYLTGELLDATGYCGGFNLQFAWASGYAAGLSAGKQVLLNQMKEDR
ncbi:MAG: BaiN/RdsA family NAD(P)/FAD-dependent oxidoreductase [Saccharofermentanales bacterium]